MTTGMGANDKELGSKRARRQVRPGGDVVAVDEGDILVRRPNPERPRREWRQVVIPEADAALLRGWMYAKGVPMRLYPLLAGLFYQGLLYHSERQDSPREQWQELAGFACEQMIDLQYAFVRDVEQWAGDQLTHRQAEP